MIHIPRNDLENQHFGLWAAEKIGIPVGAFGQFSSMAFLRDGKLACVVVIGNYCPPVMCEAFIASVNPNWASKQNIQVWGRWVFGQLGVRRVNSYIEKKNKRSRKFVEGVGWKLEGTLRKAALNGDDLCIYGLLKHDFEDKWFDGQEIVTVSAAAG